MRKKVKEAWDWLSGTAMVFLWSGFTGLCVGIGIGLGKGKRK